MPSAGSDLRHVWTIDGNEHLAELLDLALEQLRPV